MNAVTINLGPACRMYFVPVGCCQFVGILRCRHKQWLPNVADEVLNSLVYGCRNKINLSRYLLYVLSVVMECVGVSVAWGVSCGNQVLILLF